MPYVWQRWLAREFRKAGLTVIEVEGWRNRGRPASTGNFDPTSGVTTHHTGTRTTADSPGPTLRTLIEGRPDLPGPLCQWSVRFDGGVVVVAAGRANHAGQVGKVVPFAPLGADGNAIFLGDEVDTNGTQKLPDAQRHAIAVTNAVALKHQRNGADRAHRHADISATGKWDIGSLTTEQVRSDARAALSALEEDDMPAYTDWPEKDRKALAKDVVDELLERDLFGLPSKKRTVGQVLKALARQQTQD
jgi:N-acetylmuramoyl-L-alanine amidase